MTTIRQIDARIKSLQNRLDEVSGTQDLIVEKMASDIEEIRRGMSLILAMLSRDPELAKLLTPDTQEPSKDQQG
ncbi:MULTISPECIES: hypothetical protein [Actinosynnema]|nr:hypothetical protein [Actinosynnema pretiosum]